MSVRDVQEIGQKLKKLPYEIRSLIEKKIELTMIVVSEQASKEISKQIYRVVGLVVSAVGALLLLVSVAIFIGQLVDNMALGFALTAIPIILIGGMFMALKPRFLVQKIRDDILNQMLLAIEKANPSPKKLSGKEETKQIESKG